MKPEKVFKRYDIRGKYPEEIDAEFAELIGKSIGTFTEKYSTGTLVVSKDSKSSSVELKRSLLKGLKSTGVTVMDAGEGPTDYAALTGKFHDAVSVQVTSSHLPLDTNGFKFMYPEGNGFLNKDLEKLKQIFREKSFIEGESAVKDISDTAAERYRDEAKKFFREYFDSIDAEVVVETMGGAGRFFLPELLAELGADVIELGENKKEPYIDPPNPSPENLEKLEQTVEEENADLGLATDMDADRLAVYHGGEWLDGNDIFALLAEIMQPKKVVASIDTSEKVEKTLDNSEFFYTCVGDPFVAEKMLEVDAELSGEPNGHYCFPDFVAYNSGTVAGLLVAAADIEKLCEKIPEYFSKRESLEVDDKEKELENLKKRVKGRFEVISEVDGIKFKTGNSTVLVRTSGSSSKLRFVSNAPTEEEAYVALKKAQMMVE